MNGNREMLRARKPKSERVVRVNITLTPMMYATLDRIISAKGFSGPVDYFSTRIRLDGGLVLRSDEQAV